LFFKEKWNIKVGLENITNSHRCYYEHLIQFDNTPIGQELLCYIMDPSAASFYNIFVPPSIKSFFAHSWVSSGWLNLITHTLLISHNPHKLATLKQFFIMSDNLGLSLLVYLWSWLPKTRIQLDDCEGAESWQKNKI
jgi:hypothetical protein